MKRFLFLLILTGFQCYSQERSQSIVKPYFSEFKYSDSQPDFQMLNHLIANKRIIAVGEATHGTKEFFDTKRELFKFLVENHGFRVLAMETEMASAETANNYVMYGIGNATVAAKRVWNTKEVLELLLWMRSHNEKVHDSLKVRIYGFDMQYPAISADYLLKANLKDKITSLIMIDTLSKRGAYSVISKGIKKAITTELESLKHNRIKWKTDTNQISLHIRLIEQYLDLRGSHGANDNIRDKYMAENVKWISAKEGADTKIMLWAHNLHVARHNGYFKTMGNHLSNHFQDQYMPIGFAFNKGEFRAWDTEEQKMKTFNFSESKSGSLPALLGTFNYSAGYLNLSAIQTDKSFEKVLTEYKGFRQLGARYNPRNNYYTFRPTFMIFDGLFFFNTTSASVPN